MHATKVENQILVEHLLGHIYEGYIGPHGVTVIVSVPFLIGFTGHLRAIATEGILHVDIDGFSEALQLPVSRNGDVVPVGYIKVVFIEINRP